MPLPLGVINSAQMGFHGEMNGVPDVGVLTDPSLECTTYSFSDELDFHPSSRVSIYANRAFGDRICTNLRYDAKQILIALRDSNKTTNLSDAVSLPIDNRESRGYGHGEMDTYRRAGDCGNSTQESRITT
jgi:hypothetical protein